MSDEDIPEKPKRKYVRRSIFGNDKADDVVNSAIEEEADRLMDENGFETDAVEVEETESKSPTGFIYQEPTTDSVTAKMMRKLGLGGRMEPMKPWKGISRWKCSKCGWETFSELKAKKHACS